MLIERLRELLASPSTIECLSDELCVSPGAVLELASTLGAVLGDSTLYLGDRPSAVNSNLQKQVQRLQSELSSKRKLITELTAELTENEKRHSWLDEIASQEEEPLTLGFNESFSKSSATAILLASDWHVGERVDSHAVNGLNEYNPDIARQRARNFFSHARFLINKERTHSEIEHCVLWLGGDLITGYIHEELEESNYLSPIEESLFIQELLNEGIKFLLETVGEVTIVCNYGNHGRIGKKKRISTGAKNSYEWLVYNHLSKQFSGVQWKIANGYFNYLKLYNYTLRFHHGDGVSYQGGIGGVTVPLIKFLSRANTQIRADIDFVGHFHTLTYHNRFVVNGSLIGVTPYSIGIGCGYERPQQGFLVVDQKHGVVAQAPILVGVDC